MPTPRAYHPPRIGPAAIAIIGLVAIAVGAAIKTGFIEIRRGSTAQSATRTDSSAITVRTGAGEVVVPRDSVADSNRSKTAAPPSAGPAQAPAPANDAPTTASAGDSNAVRPTPAELAELAAKLIVPVSGVQPSDLVDSFDEPRGSRPHNALDIPAPRGTPVLAATDGRVLRLFNSTDGGLMVYQSDPSDRFVLVYGHLDRYATGLADGMPLRRGDTIGYVGTTGNAPPNLPHLHFAIARTSSVAKWWTGMPVDPQPLLRH